MNSHKPITQANQPLELRVIGKPTFRFDENGDRIYTNKRAFHEALRGEILPPEGYFFVRHERTLPSGDSFWDDEVVETFPSTDYGRAVAQAQAVSADNEFDQSEADEVARYHRFRSDWYETDNPLSQLGVSLDTKGDPLYARDDFYSELDRELTYLLESEDMLVEGSRVLVRRQETADNQPLRGRLQTMRWVMSTVFRGNLVSEKSHQWATSIAEMLSVVNPQNVEEVNRAYVFGRKRDGLVGIRREWSAEMDRVAVLPLGTKPKDLTEFSATYKALKELATGLLEIASSTETVTHVHPSTPRYIGDEIIEEVVHVPGYIFGMSEEEIESSRPASDFYPLKDNDVDEYQFAEGELQNLVYGGLIDDLLTTVDGKKKVDRIVYCFVRSAIRDACKAVAAKRIYGGRFRQTVDKVRRDAINNNIGSVLQKEFAIGPMTQKQIDKGEFTEEEARGVFHGLNLKEQLNHVWRLYRSCRYGNPEKVSH